MLKDHVQLPVIAAPMFLVSGTEMVIESCKQGIIGTFPLLNARTGEQLERWMTEVKDALDQAKQDDPEATIAPWGVNLIVHRSNARYEEDLERIRQFQPPVVITSLGNPTPVVEVVHSYGGIVMSDVITTKHAKKAAGAGVDGLILVSSGAGGHGGLLNPMAFIAEVKQFFDGTIVLAGCISSGREVLAAEVLGADLAYMGTRFIATEEAMAQPEYKQMLVEANTDDILYTDAISGVNANFLIPSMQAAGLDPTNLQPAGEVDVTHTKKEAKSWKDVWSAGQGVTSVKTVASIKDTVKEIKAEYEKAADEISAKRA
ncbi:nitronate monooxygenase family protein [Geomicrobium sp. JCM 19039]|uniref:NAD(P)H-dependent flavin oxidoreductase n=1 Tax=Geomicrobium sp. JCM 19039 TaxID=1460636 RepID=UPI00045F15D3|nr:nitronate monooxygenase [Geomicrobium sp. JCM 19039]GAK13039.1 dioxygenase [Geomicrobium sp. JCM 19039]